jgi:hypothetical protein
MPVSPSLSTLLTKGGAAGPAAKAPCKVDIAP